MDQPLAIVLIAAAAVALIFVLVKAAQKAAERERQRVTGLTEWARLNGFAWSPQDSHNLDARFRGVFEIGRGHARYAFEVLARHAPVDAFIFRYHFKTWETRTVTHRDARGNTYTTTERYEETHQRRYLIIELRGEFPSLLIRPEGWFDKLKGFMGFDDVNFESDEFSRKYFVKTPERQFAYAIIHPRLMERLLTEEVSLQLQNGMLLMELSGSRHDAASCHVRWSHAAEFVNNIPPFVWQDYGKRPPVELPEPVAPDPGR